MRRTADCYDYLTTRRLIEDTYSLIGDLPPEIDAVVGMARSGLISAGVIATHLHVPLYSISKEHLHPCGSGSRLDGQSKRPAHVLLVDDTTNSGRQMAHASVWTAAAFPKARIYRAVIYASPQTLDTLDYVACVLDPPHYLEWNLWNSYHVHQIATDWDGILNADCPIACDDDGPKYEWFLKNAVQLVFPRRERLSAIVTARMSKYRAICQEWLKRAGIGYHNLIMGPWKTLDQRGGAQNIAEWKAHVYRQLPMSLFVESCPYQAQIIACLVRKPVACPLAEKVFTNWPEARS